jgi:hypothetical protein
VTAATSGGSSRPGQAVSLAAGLYRWDAQKRGYVPDALEVLALEGARIKHITAFAIPEIFRHFGLPDELPS